MTKDVAEKPTSSRMKTSRASRPVSGAVSGVSVVPAGGAGAIPPLPAPGPARLTPRDAYFAPSELVDADAAVGRVSADALAAYPPGIPNIVPGEEITAETVAFLQAVAASPIGYVRGALEPHVGSFRVVTGSGG